MDTGSIMRRILLAFAVLLIAGPRAGWANEVAAWAALRQGGHVALMRHADAPGGAGDPAGFRLDDCATQRNLSERGRTDARAVGARLKAERISFTLMSSPWCRCMDTARLLGLGEPQVAATFSNVVVLSDQRQALTQGARAVVGSWQGPANLLVVTHGANIQALTGGFNPASGEIVVVRGEAGGAVREIGRIPVPGS